MFYDRSIYRQTTLREDFSEGRRGSGTYRFQRMFDVIPGWKREGEDFPEGDRGHKDFKHIFELMPWREIVRVWLTLRGKWCEKSNSRLPTSDFRLGCGNVSDSSPFRPYKQNSGETKPRPKVGHQVIPLLINKHAEDMRFFFRKIQGSSLASFAPSNFCLLLWLDDPFLEWTRHIFDECRR